MSSIHERRQRTKLERDAYRAAARKLTAHVGDRYAGEYISVPAYAHVSEDADGTGAFVECTIWVPREKLEA